MKFALWIVVLVLLAKLSNMWLFLGFFVLSGIVQGIRVMNSGGGGDFDFSPIVGIFMIVVTFLIAAAFLFGKFVF